MRITRRGFGQLLAHRRRARHQAVSGLFSPRAMSIVVRPHPRVHVGRYEDHRRGCPRAAPLWSRVSDRVPRRWTLDGRTIHPGGRRDHRLFAARRESPGVVWLGGFLRHERNKQQAPIMGGSRGAPVCARLFGRGSRARSGRPRSALARDALAVLDACSWPAGACRFRMGAWIALLRAARPKSRSIFCSPPLRISQGPSGTQSTDIRREIMERGEGSVRPPMAMALSHHARADEDGRRHRSRCADRARLPVPHPGQKDPECPGRRAELVERLSAYPPSRSQEGDQGSRHPYLVRLATRLTDLAARTP